MICGHERQRVDLETAVRSPIRHAHPFDRLRMTLRKNMRLGWGLLGQMGLISDHGCHPARSPPRRRARRGQLRFRSWLGLVNSMRTTSGMLVPSFSKYSVMNEKVAQRGGAATKVEGAAPSRRIVARRDELDRQSHRNAGFQGRAGTGSTSADRKAGCSSRAENGAARPAAQKSIKRWTHPSRSSPRQRPHDVRSKSRWWAAA